MNILLVITGLGMGGAERLVTSLADYYAGADHRVLLVYLTGDMVVSPRHQGVEISYLALNSIFNFPGAYIKLRRIIRNFKPDVVHSHMVHANLISRLVRLTCKFQRLVCTAHSTDEGGRLRMLSYRVTDFLADISTNVSVAAVNSFIEKGAASAGRMIPVPNGIDTSQFTFSSEARERIRKSLGISEEQKLILSVGRLEPQKDYPNFLSALALLKNIRGDFVVCIVGDGRLRSDLESSIEALGLNGVVRLLGIRRDISEIMCAADVYVLSSACEGFGLVVAEAMACQRVVVATDCGGVGEVVGDAGILVPVRNHELLSRALQKALSLDLPSRERLSRSARQRIVQMYSFETAASRYLELYKTDSNGAAL